MRFRTRISGRRSNLPACFGLVSFLALMSVHQAAWADSAQQSFDIPAQSLAASLQAVVTQSHVQLLYSLEVVGKIKAPAVKGSITAEEALRQLLQGTGLRLEATGDNSYAIVKAGTVSGSAAPVAVLDTVTVTATRTENATFDSPNSVAIITEQQIEDSQAHDMADVVRLVPGATMDGGPRQTGQTPAIRGMSGSEIILLVDGARRDYSDGIFNPLVIDPDLVKQVDIVRGPTSAIYGSGGMGGVMALQTIEAEDVLAPNQTMGGWVKASHRTGDDSFSENETAAARYQDVSILESMTLRDAFTEQLPTDGPLPNKGEIAAGMVKLNYAVNANNSLKFGYQQEYETAISPQNPSGNLTNPNLQNTIETGRQFNGTWAFHDSGAGLIDGKITSYLTDTKIITDPMSPSLVNYMFYTETFGNSIQNTSTFRAGDWLTQRVTYGVDQTLDMATNTGNGTPDSVEPDGHRETIGGYAQDEMHILRDWLLTAALRYDTFDISSSGANSSASHLSPKVSLHWQPQPFLGLFVGYAEGFRAPTLTETLQSLLTDNALFNFAPNPHLKPETVHDVNAGFTLAFDDLLTSGDSLRTKTTIFDERVDNLIESTVIGVFPRNAPYKFFGLGPTGLIFQDDNIENARRWGGEAELSYKLHHLDVGLGYSYIRVTDADTGANLFSPPDKLVAGLNYHVDDYWSVRYDAQFVASQHYDSTTIRQRDGYAVHDIGTTYNRDWYRIDFGITNLFNKAYVTYGQDQAAYYTYEEGRSFNLTFKARF